VAENVQEYLASADYRHPPLSPPTIPISAAPIPRPHRRRPSISRILSASSYSEAQYARFRLHQHSGHIPHAMSRTAPS